MNDQPQPIHTPSPWLLALLLALLSACGGGGGTGTPTPSDEGLANLTPELVDTTEQVVPATDGATLQVGGATLTVPPAALSDEARLGLREYRLPEGALPAADTPAPTGQRPLWDSGFIPVVDRDVTLHAPLRLRLPVHPERLPPGVTEADLHVSVLMYGEAIPQSWPVHYDAARAAIEVELPYTALYADLRHQLPLGDPQGRNALFTALIGVASLIPVLPLMATVDDITTPFTYTALVTDHFKLRYRSSEVNEADVRTVADALEYAHGLFVDRMGFDLPADWDDQYTFYIDDFNHHAFFRFRGFTEANGLTLSPSPFIEGAGYVNAVTPVEEWPLTAVHEYFHALQYGELSTALPAHAYATIMTDATWLFEGTAAALSARAIAGGAAPTRDDSLNLTITQEMSLFDEQQGPPPEVTQDFFVFLERRLGSLDFYRATFRGLDSFELGPIPNSVATLDEVLHDQGPPPLNTLASAWRAFVLDRVLDHPDTYGFAVTPAHQTTLDGNGRGSRLDIRLPPLSYALVRLGLPRFRNDRAESEQPGALVLQLQEPSASLHLGVRLNATRNGQRLPDYPQPLLLQGGRALVTTETLRDSDAPVFVDVLLYNDALEGEPLRVRLDARLRNEAQGVGLAGYFYVDPSAPLGSAARYGARLLDLETGNQWTVADATEPVMRITALGRNGEVLLRGDDAVTLMDDWGHGQRLDLATHCDMRGTTDEAGMGDTGIAYVAGEQWHRPPGGGDERVRSGLFQATMAGCDFLEVDRNGNGQTGDPEDDLYISGIKVSLDGLRIFFIDRGTLATVTATGEGYRALLDGIRTLRAVDHDGTRLLVEDDNGHLLTVDTADGHTTDLTQRTGSDFLPRDGQFADLSPDGNRVALTGWRRDLDQNGILELAVDGDWTRWRTEPGLTPSQLHYTADGEALLVAGGDDHGGWDLYLYDTQNGDGPSRLTDTPNTLEVVTATR